MKRRQKWFIAGAILTYLFVGIWLGSLSYNIYQNPSSYSYLTRFAFYPVFTVLKEGWMCSIDKKDKSSKCFIKSEWVREQEDGVNVVGILKNVSLSRDYARTIYVTTMAVSWPLKVVLNIVSIVLIFVLIVSLPVVISLILLLFAFLAGLIVIGFAKFLLLL